MVPGGAGRAEVNEIDRRPSDYNVAPAVPRNIVNFAQGVTFPILLGVALATFGIATHLHLPLTLRRRRELALLKMLGLVNDRCATRSWQATPIALVGVVLGVPIGIVVGGAVCRAFAASLGAVPLTDVSLAVVVGIACGLWPVSC